MALNKYRAKAVRLDGYRFDSQMEARRYQQLLSLARGNLIRDLTVHPTLPIVINQQRVCTVELDFRYYDLVQQEPCWEDVKGHDTALSRLKRKLVKAVHGIDVNVIKRV